MSNDLIKKIAIGILIPIFVSIVGWATWVTRQAFSAQRTETILQEYRTDTSAKQMYIQEELKGLKESVTDSFDKLNDKIDKNTQDNNKILLDLQKQIGDLSK